MFSAELPSLVTVARAKKHNGKAPPVEFFTGENPEVRVEDWLPVLGRATCTNDRKRNGSSLYLDI